ncbi:hypothetical protein JX266_014352 [Neoarthrinium moseri]|nr:hypothetical protein JX266_014352 [Neoarthrinium moseri]
MSTVIHNSDARDFSALTIPLSTFQAAIQESAFHLHQWQVYANRLRYDNDRLRSQVEQLIKQTEEMRTAHRLQEEQSQGLKERITLWERQLAGGCVLSDELDYLPTQISRLETSTQTTPTYHPAPEPSFVAYDEAMALVEVYDPASRYPTGQKRQADEVLEGDVKRQALGKDWPESSNNYDGA